MSVERVVRVTTEHKETWSLEHEPEGYAVLRNGERYDFIPLDIIRIFVDMDTLLETWLEGGYAYETDALPPECELE